MSKKLPVIQQAKDTAQQLRSEENILKERLHKAWILTCEAFGIDPENPPKMEKKCFFAGTHEDHQKYMDELEKNMKRNKQDDIKNSSHKIYSRNLNETEPLVFSVLFIFTSYLFSPS